MKKNYLFYTLFLLTAGMALAYASSELQEGDAMAQPPGGEEPEDALQAFDKMMAVLTHKRCVNCHPAGDRPRQGEDSHYHNFGVRRGEDNHGLPALRCETCHQQENNNFSGVPGAPEWSLAPLSMQWEGLSRVEIARSMLDPARNGGRTLEETVRHLTEHELVLWAWEPGVDASGTPREKPPVPKDEYIKAVKAWAEAGAPIPEE
ncbi:MAG: hypothetical protein H6556_31750 [Lewinellaceae bacterium]|nr:hypothetical protein [Lewinellaceae bacterium]